MVRIHRGAATVMGSVFVNATDLFGKAQKCDDPKPGYLPHPGLSHEPGYTGGQQKMCIAVHFVVQRPYHFDRAFFKALQNYRPGGKEQFFQGSFASKSKLEKEKHCRGN